MSERNHHRARVAALSRYRAPDDPALTSARAALYGESLIEQAERLAGAASSLTPAQRERMGLILGPLVASAGASAGGVA